MKRPYGKITCDCGCLNNVKDTELRNGKLFWVDYIDGHKDNPRVYKYNKIELPLYKNIKISYSDLKTRIYKKSYSPGTYHVCAWILFGKDTCSYCGITLKDYNKRQKDDKKRVSRFHMHNSLEPKNYSVMEQHAWMCLCNKCHMKIEKGIYKSYISDKIEYNNKIEQNSDNFDLMIEEF